MRCLKFPWFIVLLVFWASLAAAAEPFLPTKQGPETWKLKILDQIWVVHAWDSATRSPNERCGNCTQGLPQGYPGPDGQCCTYGSFLVDARHSMYLIVKAGLLFGVADCAWLDAQESVVRLGVTCSQLQHEFDP